MLYSAQMQSTAADVATQRDLCVGLCVSACVYDSMCVLGISVNCAKTGEPIKMPFGRYMGVKISHENGGHVELDQNYNAEKRWAFLNTQSSSVPSHSSVLPKKSQFIGNSAIWRRCCYRPLTGTGSDI